MPSPRTVRGDVTEVVSRVLKNHVTTKKSCMVRAKGYAEPIRAHAAHPALRQRDVLLRCRRHGEHVCRLGVEETFLFL